MTGGEPGTDADETRGLEQVFPLTRYTYQSHVWLNSGAWWRSLTVPLPVDQKSAFLERYRYHAIGMTSTASRK